MFKALTFSTIALSMMMGANAHGRWVCPPPRDALDDSGAHIPFVNTGNKVGPCGPKSGQFGFGEVTKLSPGWTTVSWEESVFHKGSPFRLAILDENEVARVVLLDHIPHNDASTPTPGVETSYTRYSMSVEIPDIKCDKCSLQFLYFMTEKTAACGIPTCFYNADDSACKGSTDPDAATCGGAPNSDVCVQEGECFSNYHSCADITISGTESLDSFEFDGQPADWPFKSEKMLYYTAESGEWTDGLLQGVPSNFTTPFPPPAGCVPGDRS